MLRWYILYLQNVLIRTTWKYGFETRVLNYLDVVGWIFWQIQRMVFKWRAFENCCTSPRYRVWEYIYIQPGLLNVTSDWNTFGEPASAVIYIQRQPENGYVYDIVNITFW